MEYLLFKINVVTVQEANRRRVDVADIEKFAPVVFAENARFPRAQKPIPGEIDFA